MSDSILVYVVERDNPNTRPDPEVFTDGKRALEKVKKEYTSQMKELGTSQENADSGKGNYGCYWNFDDNTFVGDALIDCDVDADRWEWKITVHEININGYIIKKFTKRMKEDSEECVKLDSEGESKDCGGCSCSVCLVQ